MGLNIVVLAGGFSSERNVSLASSKAICTALVGLGHAVTPLDPATGAEVLWPAGPVGATASALPTDEDAVSAGLAALIRHPAFLAADCIFNGLHGGIGENGILQGLMDALGKTYTGSGALASALAMDKYHTKRMFDSVGVRTPPYLLSSDCAEIRKSIPPPRVVKPNSEGSTVGLTIVQEENQLEPAVELAKRYGDVLVESYIAGREITVAVLEDSALPVIEIIPEGGFYDYEHKYTKGKTQYHCPADLLQSQAEKVKHQAILAHRALRCSGYSRIDFRLGLDNQFYCLEVNTLPGMTETSLVPKAAAAAGMNFEQLIERILRSANA